MKRPKTGGRKKGTPNKSTASFRATLDSLGFDVAEEAVKLFRVEMPIDQRLKLLDLIATYSHQKPKPIDQPVPPPDASASKPTLTVVSNSELTQLLKLPNVPGTPTTTDPRSLGEGSPGLEAPRGPEGDLRQDPKPT